MNFLFKSFVFLLLAAFVTTGCSNSKKDDSDGSNDPVSDSGGTNVHEYKYSELHRIEDFDLIERNGSSFGTKDLKGKVFLVSFFFSTCKCIWRIERDKRDFSMRGYSENLLSLAIQKV